MTRIKYPLAGRLVAITGATGGLGRALAPTLIARGARLALLDRDEAATLKMAAALGDHLAAGWSVDVRNLATLQQAMDEAAKHFGQIDVVIAGAGIDVMGPLETLDPAAFERVIDINLTGVWRTFRAALPHVLVTKGYLLGISSMAAFIHSPMQAHYAASKAGVQAMCDSFRLEMRGRGVGVGSAHPTFFQTPMMDDVVADPAGHALWGGHVSWVWKYVPIATVVNDIVGGIERRKNMIVVPKANTPLAMAPSLIRRWLSGWASRNAASTERSDCRIPRDGTTRAPWRASKARPRASVQGTTTHRHPLYRRQRSILKSKTGNDRSTTNNMGPVL